MASVKITHYGMEGEGRNVTEARKDAGRKIRAVLGGSYEPAILECRGNAILVWRDPQGWYARIIQRDSGAVEGSRGTTLLGVGRAEAIERARGHLAALAWWPADGTNPPFPLSRREAANFNCWAEFQLRFREARARGMADDDAYDWATRNPARPELFAADPR